MVTQNHRQSVTHAIIISSSYDLLELLTHFQKTDLNSTNTFINCCFCFAFVPETVAQTGLEFTV